MSLTSSTRPIEVLALTAIARGSIAPSADGDVAPAAARAAGRAPNTKSHVDHARIVQRNRTTYRALHRGPQRSATTRN
jgi:hypothetical protein